MRGRAKLIEGNPYCTSRNGVSGCCKLLHALGVGVERVRAKAPSLGRTGQVRWGREPPAPDPDRWGPWSSTRATQPKVPPAYILVEASGS